jgi:hypothetical protein
MEILSGESIARLTMNGSAAVVAVATTIALSLSSFTNDWDWRSLVMGLKFSGGRTLSMNALLPTLTPK